MFNASLQVGEQVTGVTDRDPPLSAPFRLAGVTSVALAVTCNVTDAILLSTETDSDRKGVMEGKCRQVGERERKRLKTDESLERD